MLRTFIVEDSPLILENLAASLEELSAVRVVGNAPDEARALAWLQANPGGCELLIADVILAAGSGLGVLKALAAARLPLRAVVLTNYATPDVRRHCLALGAERVFDKSSELEELFEYCRTMAAGMQVAAA